MEYLHRTYPFNLVVTAIMFIGIVWKLQTVGRNVDLTTSKAVITAAGWMT